MPDRHDSDSVQGRWTHYGSIGHSYDWPSPSPGIARPEGIVASGIGMPAILHAGRWKMTATIKRCGERQPADPFPCSEERPSGDCAGDGVRSGARVSCSPKSRRLGRWRNEAARRGSDVTVKSMDACPRLSHPPTRVSRSLVPILADES